MKILSIVLSLFFCVSLVAQNNAPKPAQPKVPQKVQIVSVQDSTVQKFMDKTTEGVSKPTYELYPTKNMWNFLKLNTITGQIWVVQYSVSSTSNQMQVPLNSSDLLWSDEAHVSGRFKLHPTDNMWNFILLDQINGNVWQVQWSTDRGKMFIDRIRDAY